MNWCIKRRVTRVSFFRDYTPYFCEDMGHGMMCSHNRAEATAFDSLEEARKVMKKIKRFDKDLYIVRVKK